MNANPPIERILMTADAVGGVWAYAIELAAALQPHGIEVDLALMGPGPRPGQLAEAAAIPNLRLHIGDFRLEWMEDPWDDVVHAGNWLLELEDTYSPSIVQINGYAHATLPWRAPTLVVAHSDVLSWHAAVRHRPAGPEWETYASVTAAGLRAADCVTAPTAAMLDMLRTHYGSFDAGPPIPNARRPEEWPAGPKQPFVMTSGRLWDEAKNVAALAAAAPGIYWPIYAAGEAPPPDPHLESVPPPLNLLGRLDRPDLAGWLARASIFALPARYEPFGLGPLEAALAGCALVLGNIRSLREVWRDAAIFVDPDDPAALTQAVNGLIADPGSLRDLASRARARALQFTPRRMAEGYLALYRRLASTASARLGETG